MNMSDGYEMHGPDDRLPTGGVAHARTSHPETSQEAAASLSNSHLSKGQQAVLEVLRDFGPMTNDQLAVCYRGQQPVRGYPRQSEQSIRSRRSDLTLRGYVRDTGDRELTATGRKTIVWAAV